MNIRGKIVTGFGAVLLLSGAFVGVNALTVEPPTGTNDRIAVVEVEPTPVPTFTTAPTTPPVAVVEAPAPAPVIEEAPTGPTLCAEGWFPNSVDADGNESNCAEGNDEGQQCVAYDENNNCTAYYKP